MMTSHELNRLRRQMHRRIRVVLAQRRLTAEQHAAAGRAEPPTTGEHPPEPATEL